MCNLSYLFLIEVDLSTCFVESDARGSHAFKDLLPSLDYIEIIDPSLSGGNWSPFTNFLSRRAAAGNQISSLCLGCHPPMDEDVVESIGRAVKVFEDEGSDDCGWGGGAYVNPEFIVAEREETYPNRCQEGAKYDLS